jgi:exonuclease III
VHPFHKPNATGHKGTDSSRCKNSGSLQYPALINMLIIQAKKINTKSSELNCTIYQMDLTDIYRIFHPTAVEYTLFSTALESFPKEITLEVIKQS